MIEELTGLMRDAIRRCALDLSGLAIMTEAASGAYAVTPVLAAMSGARRVFAFARDSQYGAGPAAAKGVLELAGAVGVAERIRIVTDRHRDVITEADIITNSGHLRPIHREMIGRMKPRAVIPLMYEAWELREADIDVAACTARSIAVAGTNERHPAVDVFSFLGPVAERLLADAGVVLRGSHIVVLCDNPFSEFIREYFIAAGATLAPTLAGAPDGVDAILIAMTPTRGFVFGIREAESIAKRSPRAVVAQFWGDIDRDALARHGMSFRPLEAPPPGHQGIMLSSIGPEPVVRLQAGGLKVGEVMARVRSSLGAGKDSCERAVAAAVASGFGQALASSSAAANPQSAATDLKLTPDRQ